MARPPTSNPAWSTTGGTRQTPSGGQRASGFAIGDRPPAKTLNELWGVQGDWINYLASLADEDTQANSRILSALANPQHIASISGVHRAFAASPGGRIVAVGDGPIIVTSDDLGMTWTARTPATYDGNFQCATYAFGLFIIAGDASGGSNTASLQTSPDGVTWTERQTLSGNNFLDFQLAGTTLYVYIGTSGHSLLSSTNGTSWSTTGSSTALRTTRNSGAFGGGLLVKGGVSSGIYTSPDGATWTARTFGSGDTMQVNEVRHRGPVAPQGFIVYGISGNDRIVQYSPDGITWTRVLREAGSVSATTGGMVASAHGAILFGDTGASVIRPCLMTSYDLTAIDTTQNFFGPGANTSSWSQCVIGRTNVLLRGSASGFVQRFAWID